MTTAISTLQEQQSLRVFKEINRHLGIRSTHKLMMLVRAVLSNVRRTLSEDQAAIVIKKLPQTFRRFLIGNWRSGEKTVSIGHLDELVDKIYQEDKRSHQALFTSEVDTLNAVILILNKLDSFFGILQLNAFGYSLKQELKQAAIEEAV
jgi:uncharacterized protein (DUF2267 family)